MRVIKYADYNPVSIRGIEAGDGRGKGNQLVRGCAGRYQEETRADEDTQGDLRKIKADGKGRA